MPCKRNSKGARGQRRRPTGRRSGGLRCFAPDSPKILPMRKAGRIYRPGSKRKGLICKRPAAAWSSQLGPRVSACAKPLRSVPASPSLRAGSGRHFLGPGLAIRGTPRKRTCRTISKSSCPPEKTFAQALTERKAAPLRMPLSPYSPANQPFFKHRLPSTSAICTAFSAAPLRRLSDTHHRFNPFSMVESSRTRLI